MRNAFLVITFALAAILVMARCAKLDQPAAGLFARGEDSPEALTYRFAFSGRIVDEMTRQPIPSFSVEMASLDPALSGVLNAMGDHEGYFHISRKPATEEHSFISVPIIITASGYAPVVQMLDLGGDCGTESCPRVVPTPFALRAIPSTQNVDNISFSSRKLQEIITAKGLPQLFKDLLRLGKWDKATESVLARSRGTDTIPSVILILKAASSQTVKDPISAVIKDIDEKKLARVPTQWNTEVASTQKEIASALVSTSELLEYLVPVRNQFEEPSQGNLAVLLHQFLGEKNIPGQLAALLTPYTKVGAQPDLAMTSLMPLLGAWLGTKESNVSVHHALVSEALSDRAMLERFKGATSAASNESPGLAVLLKYAGPLIQALNAKEGKTLVLELNAFLGKEPIRNLRELVSKPHGASPNRLESCLLPISKGLKSSDAQALTTALGPFLARANPGEVLKNIVEKLSSYEVKKGEAVLAALYPAASDWANHTVPAKQLFATQLVAGLYSGDLKEVRVKRDLKLARAVVVSAQVRDIFKLSLLPNVERIVVLP